MLYPNRRAAILEKIAEMPDAFDAPMAPSAGRIGMNLRKDRNVVPAPANVGKTMSDGITVNNALSPQTFKNRLLTSNKPLAGF